MISRAQIISKQTSNGAQVESSNGFGNVSIKSLQPTRNENNNLNYYKYRVRVPIIHGDGIDSYSVPNDQLPFATYCPVPGSSYVELNVGDLVYVAEVDYNFDDFVILGLIPDSQIYSESGLSIQRAKSLQTDQDASVHLGNKTRIGYGENEITPENIQSLKGFEHQLTTHVWETKNGGTGVQLDDTEESKKLVRDNFGIYSTVIISQEDFNQLAQGNNGSLEKNTIYYIWDNY